MNRSIKHWVGPAIAGLALLGSVSGLEAAPVTLGAAAAGQPVAGTASVSPTQMNTADLPVISGSATAVAPQDEETDGPAAPGHIKKVMSPDDNTRKAAQEGKGPKGKDVDRSKLIAQNSLADAVASGAVAALGPASEAPSANPPGAVNLQFNGLQQCQGDAAFCWNPPDQAIAGGPAHVLEANNEKLEVFDRNGNVVSGPFSLQSWFGTASNVSLFDPVATFRGGHFYLVALETGSSTSTIHLSVSRTNQANGSWCNYAFNGKLGNSWADYPKLGVTVGANSANSRLLIATNEFDFSSGGFTNNFVQELPKAQLDACAGFSFTTWSTFTDANDGSIAFTLVPAVNYDNTGDFGWYLATARFGSGSGITVWRNVFGTGFQRFLVDTLDYSNPPGATQPGTSTRIDTIDDRLQSFQIRYNKAWGMHTIDLGGCGSGNDTAVVHIFQAFTPNSTATPSLVTVSDPGSLGGGTRDGLIVGACGTHQYNGSVSNDANGNALFTYTESGTAEPGTQGYEAPRVGGWHLETGFSYGGFLGAVNPGFVNTTGRNGDYSAAALDSIDQRFVWVGNETLIANNFWGTRIGRLINSANAI